MASDPHDPALAVLHALERLGSLSLRTTSMDDLLQTVTDLARAVTPGRPECSLMLLVRNRPTTVARTGRLAAALDQAQYDRGSGPCLHAARAGELAEVADTHTETRWPGYALRASEHRVRSSLSVPLSIDDALHVSGSLNLYSRQPGAFRGANGTAASRFAPYAAVAIGNLLVHQAAVDRGDNLRIALETRAVIDQAKGILMDRHGITADQAFQVLSRSSMATNRKLRAIAQDLVGTGELPSGHLTGDGATGPGRPTTAAGDV